MTCATCEMKRHAIHSFMGGPGHYSMRFSQTSLPADSAASYAVLLAVCSSIRRIQCRQVFQLRKTLRGTTVYSPPRAGPPGLRPAFISLLCQHRRGDDVLVVGGLLERPLDDGLERCLDRSRARLRSFPRTLWRRMAARPCSGDRSASRGAGTGSPPHSRTRDRLERRGRPEALLPPVSRIWSVTNFPSTSSCLDEKSEPIVALC
jgi:hypothetical protein